MNLLFLSPNMAAYEWAMYQQDAMSELARQADVVFYGPGFARYSRNDTLADVIARMPAPPDVIVLGHAWLADGANTPINQYSHIDPASVDIPKVAILNKEYSRLDDKLNELRRCGIRLLLSHHHDAAAFADRAGCPAIFWPFAFDHRVFYPAGPKSLDLGFSGILQNPTPGNQSDLRVRIMQELFECDGDLPIRPRADYQALRVVFNALPRDADSRRRNDALKIYRRLSTPEYAQFVRSARIFLCTKSPANLVSPRIFECLASATIPLVEENPVHRLLFDRTWLTEFRDVHDFREHFLRMLREPPSEARLLEIAGQMRSLHSWQARVRQMLDAIAVHVAPVGVPDR